MKFAPSQKLRHRAYQAGLTLIELLVVLVILTGIGGLLVPTINSALNRTHVATCAQTFPEVHMMIQRAQIENPGSFGTDFDSGIWGTGASGTGVTDGESVNGAFVEDLTGPEAEALNAVGINGVVDHNNNADDYTVTFNIGAVSRSIVAGAATGTPPVAAAPADPVLITLTDEQAESLFLPNATAGTGTGSPTGEKYVWLGIGRDWSLLGSVAPEPPAHFGDTPGALPDEVHSRFGILMQVTDSSGDALDAAQFRRVSYTLNGTGFETADNHLEVYWEELNQSN